MEFKELVKKAIDQGLTRDLAEEFEVAESTVKRWASGVANPHPIMKKLISTYIESRLK